MNLAPAAQAALLASGIDVHDGEPPTTPAGRYVALFGGSGLATAHRNGTVPHWQNTALRAVCVARTRDGLRDLVADVRQVLTGRRIDPTFGVLRETVEGPELSGGPDGDRRLSMTLTYACLTPSRKETP